MMLYSAITLVIVALARAGSTSNSTLNLELQTAPLTIPTGLAYASSAKSHVETTALVRSLKPTGLASVRKRTELRRDDFVHGKDARSKYKTCGKKDGVCGQGEVCTENPKGWPRFCGLECGNPGICAPDVRCAGIHHLECPSGWTCMGDSRYNRTILVLGELSCPGVCVEMARVPAFEMELDPTTTEEQENFEDPRDWGFARVM